MTVLLSPSNDLAAKRILAIRDWFASTRGQRLLSHEQPIIQAALSHYIGRYFLYWGPLASLPMPSNLSNDVFHLGIKNIGADVVCEERAWPILSESISAVVLQHSLDFACSAHDLLREAARCVRPGGHLLIAGINPYSGLGVYRRCCFNILGKSNSISRGKLVDWLKLLGFTVEKQWLGVPQALSKKAWCPRLFAKMETLGFQLPKFNNGFYIISARKLMMQVTPDVNSKRFVWERLVPCPVANRGDVKIDERDC